MGWEYFYFAFVFFLAGIVPELTGFGVATVSMVFLSFVLPLHIAIPLVAIISLTATGIVAFHTKAKGFFKYLKPLLLGSFVGVFLGMLFLSLVREDLLRTILAIFFIVYAFYGLFLKNYFFPMNRKIGTTVGLVAGFFGASFNIHGPFVGLYSSASNHLSKIEIKDLIATYMFITGLFTVAGHFLFGRITGEVLNYVLFVLPFLFVGLFVGKKIFERTSAAWVKRYIYFFVLIAGIMLLI